MNSINIRYHVISLVAVFLALGVGIFVGSSINIFNVDSLVKKQEALIGKQEKNYNEWKKQSENDRARLKESQDYIAELEQKSIPLLMEGRLRGMNVGIVLVGDFPRGSDSDSVVIDLLNRADCIIAYKLKFPLAAMESYASGRHGNLSDDLAAELVLGSEHSSDLTSRLQTDGAVLAGNFEKPVKGMIFVLGENIDANLATKYLLPLQSAVDSRDKAVVNVTFGKYKSYEDLFSDSKAPLLQGIETPSSQAALINRLAQHM